MAGVSGVGSSQAQNGSSSSNTVQQDWSLAGDPVQAALDFLNNTDQYGNQNSGLSVTLSNGGLKSDYDKDNPKFDQSVQQLLNSTPPLSQQDFNTKLQSLVKTSGSPTPGIKQQYMAQVQNIQNQVKSGKMSASDAKKAVGDIQTDFNADEALDQGQFGTLGYGSLSSYDPTSDQTSQNLLSALRGEDPDD